MERLTQIEAVKRWLLSGKTITSNEAKEVYGISRLADLIFKLRREGYEITNIQRATITKLGGKAWFVEYKLLNPPKEKVNENQDNSAGNICKP